MNDTVWLPRVVDGSVVATVAGLGPGSTVTHPSADLVLVVGPEGGWSDAERAKLGAAGAAPIALGARVLRAETAVFAGLAVVQHRLGDLR